MSKVVTLPGLIDCHVHFREPGFPHKATMETEARAALAGGVVTVCEMPNTSPPTQTIEALRDKVRRAERVPIDMRFFFNVTSLDHCRELERLWTDEALADLRRRCPGLKLFLENSTGNLKTPTEVVEAAFELCGRHAIPIVAHCEDSGINAEAERECSRSDVAAHSIVRPPESEGKAIEYALDLTAKHGAKFHVVHLTTAQGAGLVRQAKADGMTVTCEACPHHLFLSTEDYDRLGTLAKMNPPLRSPEHREALWAAIADGTIDCVATDHAPHTLEEKRSGPPLKAPSGVPGVETMLPLLASVASGLWPHPDAANPGASLTFDDIVRLCRQNPDRIYDLGVSDDVTIKIDTEREWQIAGENLHGNTDWTPFDGWTVRGKVLSSQQQ